MNLHDFISEYSHELISMIIGAVTATIIIVGFIGYKKMGWLVKELVKMYSANEKSYFGKKRIESGIAFIILQHGMLFWLAKKYDVMTTTDFIMWATVEAAISGWMISAIQKEKTTSVNGDNNTGNGTTQ